MIAFASIILISFFAPEVSAKIGADLNCTAYNGSEFVYAPSAVICSNIISDAACEALYPAADGPPSAGNDSARPYGCYITATATPAPFNQDMKNAALTSCPKRCGYCCQTDAYNCANAAYPRLDCKSIVTAQCNSPAWRTIIAQDCPSACGLCNEGGCVDAVTNCATDISICSTVGMQDFVNTYCQKTCGRCPSTTTSVSSGTAATGTCTSYAADTSSSCAAWARNGFCSNNFYTVAQRKSRCATTCKMC